MNKPNVTTICFCAVFGVLLTAALLTNNGVAAFLILIIGVGVGASQSNEHDL